MSLTPELPRRRRIVFSIEVALLVALTIWAGRTFQFRSLKLWSSIVDDSYISLRHARNLAYGHGLVYNPGERVEGYTNFLFTVGLAVPFVLGADAFYWTKMASVLSVLALAAATFLLALRALPRRDEQAPREILLAGLPAVLVLLSPLMAISAGEGLETTFFTFLLVLAAALFLGEAGEGAFPWSALVAALLGMTRPDGVLLAPWLFLVAILWGRRRPYLQRFAILFLVTFGAYYIGRYLYYGYPFPNTFYAKAIPGGDTALWQRGWRRLREFVTITGGWTWLAMTPAFLLRRTRASAAMLGGIVAQRIAFHLWSGAPYIGEHRFLVPVVPFLGLLLALAAAAVLPWRTSRVAGAALLGVALLAPAWRDYPRAEYRLRYYGDALRRGHVALGKKLRDTTSPTAVIAMVDVGATPYYSERETVDLLGLCDEHIGHMRGRFGGRLDAPYILSRHPDLVVLVSRDKEVSRPEQFTLAVESDLYSNADFHARYCYQGHYEFHRRYWLHLFRRIDSRAFFEGEW